MRASSLTRIVATVTVVILVSSAMAGTGVAQAQGAPGTPSPAPTIMPVEVALTDSSARLTPQATDGKSGSFTRLPGVRVTQAPSQPSVASDTNPSSSAVLTQAIETGTFTVSALAWGLGSAMSSDHHIYLRVFQTNGGWTSWSSVEPSEPAQGSAKANGTDPYISGPATRVQVQITGDPATLPEGLKLVIAQQDAATPASPTGSPAGSAAIGGSTGSSAVPSTAAPTSLPTPAATSQPSRSVAPSPSAVTASASSVGPAGGSSPSIVPGSPSATGSALRVVSQAQAWSVSSTTSSGYTFEGRYGMSLGIHPRQSWDAGSPAPTWDPEPATLQAAILHHTAGTNDYAQTDVPGIIAGIDYYHTVTLGWGDIGYNFLVDKYGGMWEGREGSMDAAGNSMIVGGHAYGNNEHSVGIAALGDYTAVQPTPQLLNAYATIIKYRFDLAGLNASDTSGFTNMNGQSLPRIFGHRDVYPTECPGAQIYSQIPALIQQVGNAGANPYSSVSDYRPWRDGGPTIWSVPYASTLYVAGASTAVPLSYDEWRLYGFDVTGRADAVPMWVGNGPTIHARLQLGNAVWYPGLNYAEWTNWGKPGPISVNVVDYLTNSVTLYLSSNGAMNADPLSYAQWLQWGAVAPTALQRGFAKLTWTPDIATYTPPTPGSNLKTWSGYVYTPLNFSQWLMWGAPTPAEYARFPSDTFCTRLGDPTVWYTGPTVPAPLAITYSQWVAAGRPTPVACS